MLAKIGDSSDVPSILLGGGHSVVAGRLAGAFRNIGRDRIADDIVRMMKSAGYDVREVDPFDRAAPFTLSAREPSPYVTRMRLMWHSMREEIAPFFPAAPFAFGDASLSQVPEASDDSAVTNPDVAIAVDVLANDSDPEGALDTGSIELQSNPVDGAATVNGDGTVTYTPDAGFIGTDGFSYTMRDQAGNESNEAFVNVRVNAPPTAADDAANVQQSEPVTIDVLANDADSDGSLDPATVAMWNSPANGGTIVESDGRITYTSGPDFSGNDSFTYRVGDNDGGVSNEATVVVSVSEAPNIPPTAVDDAATTEEDAPVTIEVLANDSDEDGTLEPATVAVKTSPDNGSAAVNADGTITYTPDAGFTGTDTFTYTVQDDDSEVSDAATVTITVNAVIDPPATPPSAPPDGGRGGGGATGLLFLVALTLALVRRWVHCGRRISTMA